MGQYDHPDYLVVRERHLSGTISAAAVGSAYIGCSLKVSQKAVVLGVQARVGSGGSAAGSNSLKVARIGTGGTISNIQVLTITTSAGASAAGDVHDISLTTPFTVASLGEAAGLVGNAASLDKVIVLSDVVWRYRWLPVDKKVNENIG